MDLEELRDAIRIRMGLPAGDSLLTDTVLTGLVNAALRQIETENDWSWLEATETINTVNGDGSYPLAADWVRTIAVQIGNDAPLKRLPLLELLYMGGASGQPLYFGFRGDELQLRPVPSGVLAVTHTYLRSEAVLSADSDEPYLPEPFQQAAVEYGAYLGFRRANNLEDAGAALAAYQEWIKRMMSRGSRLSVEEGGGEVPSDQAAAETAKAARKG